MNIDDTLPGSVIFFLHCLVPGRGSFQLSSGFGLWVMVRVVGSVYHNRFPNYDPSLNPGLTVIIP